MKKITILVIIISCFVMCKKNEVLPKVPLDSILIDGPWQLISATQFSRSGIISNRSIGLNADSVIFQFAANSNNNLVLTNIKSYIIGTNTNCTYNIIGSAGTPNPYDTIVCNPAWKPQYSDTLFVSGFSDQLLVFKINNSNGYEVDSLKKIRCW